MTRTLFAADLASRVFTVPDVYMADLRSVEIADLDPFLRSLLLTDGTVTRALEAQLLSGIAVEVVDQSTNSLESEAAAWLAMERGETAIQRRVVIKASSPPSPIAYAESHIVPHRLPPDFMATLSMSREGIGEALQQVHLESRRELLWFGLGTAADWVELGGETPALIRLYRLITGGAPAMLIIEGFAVRHDSGIYRLAAPGQDKGNAEPWPRRPELIGDELT